MISYIISAPSLKQTTWLMPVHPKPKQKLANIKGSCWCMMQKGET